MFGVKITILGILRSYIRLVGSVRLVNFDVEQGGSHLVVF